METFQTATIEELARADGWSPIRRHFGIRAFGVNGWSAQEAGAPVIPDHDETPSGHEELYLVTTGRATFAVDGREIDAPAGTLVHVPDPDVKRSAVAVEPGTSVVAVGARPGEAYKPRSWELNADGLVMFDEGRWADAKAHFEGALGEYEEDGLLLYNLACAEAQLGEADAAIEHLTAALEYRPDLAGNARIDTDLDAIREDPRFPVRIDPVL